MQGWHRGCNEGSDSGSALSRGKASPELVFCCLVGLPVEEDGYAISDTRRVVPDGAGGVAAGRAGAAGVDRGRRQGRVGSGAPGRHRRGQESRGRLGRHGRHGRQRDVPVPGTGGGQLRSHCEPAGLQHRQVSDRAAGPRSDQESRSGVERSRRRRERTGDGRVAAHRHEAERACHEHPQRADRPAAEGPRFHDPRHAGRGRQPGDQAGRHLD